MPRRISMPDSIRCRVAQTHREPMLFHVSPRRESPASQFTVCGEAALHPMHTQPHAVGLPRTAGSRALFEFGA